MIIDIVDNRLTIGETSASLKPNHVSQLLYWGFIHNSSQSYQLLQGELDSILPKLLKYLDKEGISYTLSPICEEYLRTVTSAIDAFNKLKRLGRDYKDGNFEKSKYAEFTSFVHNNITRKLKEHQIKSAFHLYLIGNGANFSVPGSGKTSVVLTVYEKLRSENKVNMLFVIGPPACFEPWRDEFYLTLGRHPDSKILAGGNQVQRRLEYYTVPSKVSELYLTTYQTIINDEAEVIHFLSQPGIKTLLVIDEAHYIKQIGGTWAETVLRIAEYANYRCILTGTPMPHNYVDVFNLFDFLWPKYHPIDSRAKIMIESYQKSNNTNSAKSILDEKIGPLFYRVRKADLNLIPQKFHPPYYISMNKYERILYDAIENKIRDYSKEDYLRNIDLVYKLRRARIIRLRQCISYAKLLTSVLDDSDENLLNGKTELMEIISKYDSLEKPAKLDYLLNIVTDLHNKNLKVVIWSHFRGTLKLITNYLSQQGFACKLIYGATPIEQTSVDDEETREMIRKEFIDPNSNLNILVANPAACGESISLHKTCYHAIYYDLSYNCAQYLQSLDRIHRVGGSEINEANYYFLQYEHSIDEDILSNLERKSATMNALVEQDYSIYSLNMFEEDGETESYNRLFGINNA